MGMEVQQHLKDCLFHGVCKHICDSVWYLYSTPGTSYSQMMVAVQKVESENEETQEKVRARATVTTDLEEGMTDLGQQTAKLVATLTQTKQGSGPFSAQVVLGNMAVDGGAVVGVHPVTQTPTMARVALAR